MSQDARCGHCHLRGDSDIDSAWVNGVRLLDAYCVHAYSALYGTKCDSFKMDILISDAILRYNYYHITGSEIYRKSITARMNRILYFTQCGTFNIADTYSYNRISRL